MNSKTLISLLIINFFLSEPGYSFSPLSLQVEEQSQVVSDETIKNIIYILEEEIKDNSKCSPEAATKLGQLYYEGKLVEKDEEKAKVYLKQAISKDPFYTKASTLLQDMLLEGKAASKPFQSSDGEAYRKEYLAFLYAVQNEFTPLSFLFLGLGPILALDYLFNRVHISSAFVKTIIFLTGFFKVVIVGEAIVGKIPFWLTLGTWVFVRIAVLAERGK